MRDLLDGKTFAVIGNAPNELGFSNGKVIDGRDVVFRFNNYKLDGFEEDYGFKTDYWVHSFYLDIKERKDGIPMLCPIPLNDPETLNWYRGTNQVFLNRNIDNTHFIPVEYFKELTQKIKRPSTGLCFLWWIYKSGVKITKDNIFGFNFFEGQQMHFFDDIKTNRTIHKGSIEKKIIHELINE